MFYEIRAKTHVRVPPVMLKEDINTAVLNRLNETFEGYINLDVGFTVLETEFKMITFLPEMQEVVVGKITDITNFGAFISIGPVDGMIHVSQTMDDFISFSKTKVLSGKESKKSLKVGDKCRARIIAVSYKDITSPKIGLTMRQPSLGNIKWTSEIKAKKESKESKKSKE